MGLNFQLYQQHFILVRFSSIYL